MPLPKRMFWFRRPLSGIGRWARFGGGPAELLVGNRCDSRAGGLSAHECGRMHSRRFAPRRRREQRGRGSSGSHKDPQIHRVREDWAARRRGDAGSIHLIQKAARLAGRTAAFRDALRPLRRRAAFGGRYVSRNLGAGTRSAASRRRALLARRPISGAIPHDVRGLWAAPTALSTRPRLSKRWGAEVWLNGNILRDRCTK